MNEVFLLWHDHEPEDRDEAKLIGVYRTEADARSAIERLRYLPGFVDWQEAFMIDRYELNQDHWIEGFVTVHPGDDEEPASRANDPT